MEQWKAIKALESSRTAASGIDLSGLVDSLVGCNRSEVAPFTLKIPGENEREKVNNNDDNGQNIKEREHARRMRTSFRSFLKSEVFTQAKFT